MKRACLLCGFLLVVPMPVLADDWATTGKGGSGGNLSAAQVEAAWTEMAQYEAGQDQKALLAMNWVVINAMNDANQRAATAARLAKVLQAPATTSAARQFICAQLFWIGTAAEVSAVAPLLLDPATTDTARLFLERVKSEAAIAALRQALDKLEGRPLIGVINSLSLIQDAASVDKMIALTKSQDAAVALAAWRALGNFGNEAAADFLIAGLQKADKPSTADGIRRRAHRHSVGLGGPARQVAGNLPSSGRRQAFPGRASSGFQRSVRRRSGRAEGRFDCPVVEIGGHCPAEGCDLPDDDAERRGFGRNAPPAGNRRESADRPVGRTGGATGRQNAPGHARSGRQRRPSQGPNGVAFSRLSRRSAGHSDSHQGLGRRRSRANSRGRSAGSATERSCRPRPAGSAEQTGRPSRASRRHLVENEILRSDRPVDRIGAQRRPRGL